MFQHVLGEVFKKRKTSQKKPPLHHAFQDRFVNIITVNNPTRQKHYYTRKRRQDEIFGDEEILNEARGFMDSAYASTGSGGIPQAQNITINVPSSTSTTTNLPTVTTPEKSWWEKGLEGAERIGEMGLEFGLAGAIAHKLGGGAVAQGASMGLIEEAKSNFPRLAPPRETPQLTEESTVRGAERIRSAAVPEYGSARRQIGFEEVSPETGRRGYVPPPGSEEAPVRFTPLSARPRSEGAITKEERKQRREAFTKTPAKSPQVQFEEKERELKTPLRPERKTPSIPTPFEGRFKKLNEAGIFPILTKKGVPSMKSAFNKRVAKYLEGPQSGVTFSDITTHFKSLSEREQALYSVPYVKTRAQVARASESEL